MDELIRRVARRAHISELQAAAAVSAMLSLPTERLPSPFVGRIREASGETALSPRRSLTWGTR